MFFALEQYGGMESSVDDGTPSSFLFGIYVRRLRGGGGSRTDIFQTTPPSPPSSCPADGQSNGEEEGEHLIKET